MLHFQRRWIFRAVEWTEESRARQGMRTAYRAHGGRGRALFLWPQGPSFEPVCEESEECRCKRWPCCPPCA